MLTRVGTVSGLPRGRYLSQAWEAVWAMAGCMQMITVMMQMNCNKYRQIPGLKLEILTPAYKDLPPGTPRPGAPSSEAVSLR